MKKNAMRLFAAAALLCAALPAAAQTNPKAGYVITNEGDTIHGTIDYLSSAKNAQACSFQRQGEEQFRRYRPGEIRGYRLADNGIFYVTRTLPVDSTQKTVFAEYMLQGGMSLYRYEEDFHEYFYLVDGDGKVAQVRTFTTDGLSKEEAKERKQRELAQAFDALKLSESATNDLWNRKVSARNMLRIARNYNDEYCEDEECITFQYDEKAARTFSARLYAGLGFSHVWIGDDTQARKAKRQFAPKLLVGAEYEMPRLSRNFTYHSIFSILAGTVQGDFSEPATVYDNIYHTPFNATATAHEKTSFLNFGVQLGVTYSMLPEKKVSPVVQAGLDLGYATAKYTTSNWKYGVMGRTIEMPDKRESIRDKGMQTGFCIGLGADIAIGRSKLRADVNYRHSFSIIDMNLLPDEIGLRVGWIF
ncbi:MAG: hypothetical protein IJ692_00010 [Alloprevotella sp.]|nr:hypothetical protein [Alloprevotella sp.]